MSSFGTILQRAEELKTDVKCGGLSKFNISHNAGMKELADGESKFDMDLTDVFSRSQKIWANKINSSHSRNTFSLKATNDANQLLSSSLKKCSDSQIEYGEGANITNPSEYYGSEQSMNDEIEVEKYVERSLERARLEMERTFLNQQILNREKHPFFEPLISEMKHEKLMVNSQQTTFTHGMLQDPEAELFAKAIDLLLSKDPNALILETLKKVSQKIDNPKLNEIWEKAFVLCKTTTIKPSDNVQEFRASKHWYNYVVCNSLEYLHAQYSNYMNKIIDTNRAKAKRGGIPSTTSLIEAYLNVVGTVPCESEDGKFEKTKHPIWAVLFYCLRLGDYYSTSNIASKFFNFSDCSSLIGVISNLSKKPFVEKDVGDKLRAEWRHIAQNCKDFYKKAVYGIFLGFDCHEVNINIEDWLWARLCNSNLHPQELVNKFRKLQLTICDECGEKYFIAEGGNPLIFFSTLLLTGQLEQALNTLFDSGFKLHATHLAILFYQLRILVVNEKVSSELLVTDIHDPTICKINLTKMVLLYVKNFELCNVNYALNYCFYLNKFDLDHSVNDAGGRNVFESCVSRLVYLSGESDQILGYFNEKDERLRGLIDKFSQAINVSDVLSRVAFDVNVGGNPFLACRIYALAARPNDAIKLLCRHLAVTMTDPKSETSLEAKKLSTWLMRMYAGDSRSSVNEKFISTLKLLTKLFDFFNMVSDRRHEQVLGIIQKIKLIPLDSSEVNSYIGTFHMVPEEVHQLLPEICVAVMNSIIALYSNQSGDSPVVPVLKEAAKALALYTATVPYRFPLSVNSVLLQLQSKII